MKDKSYLTYTMKHSIIKLVLFLCLFIISDVTIAEEAKKLSSWIDYFQEATVAIGVIKSIEYTGEDSTAIKKDFFKVIGTGVLFGLPDDTLNIPMLVTAKHVFIDTSKNWEPTSLQIRFKWFEERPFDEYLGITIDLKDGTNKLWFSHPNAEIDLACLPLIIPIYEAGGDKINIIPSEDFACADDIFEGASVFVLGYPGAIGGAFLTKAIVRQGIISWISPVDPESNYILIDCNIFPGNSGGPVLKIPTGIDRHGSFKIGGKVKLLGIVSKNYLETLPLTKSGLRKIEIPIQKDGKIVYDTLISQEFIDIGVIEPASRVKELLLVVKKKLH
ncbi:MAG: trypsin-like peptidase domain-containing protein [FCB group bacterium]|nr:trypsin-like peptidase domain-containing protein [FCB group bacterium]